MKYPRISIVMPVYNEGDKIERCLKSIREQDYPQDKIEIVLVDDNSTDNTLEIAEKFNVKLVKNGNYDYDIGKSLGIKNSTGEYLMFLDGDNILTCNDWIKRVLKPLLKDESIIGSQPLWFKYNPKDSLFDRYGSLLAVTDPLTIYLKKRDRLMLGEKKWKIGLIKEESEYFVAKFNKKNLPTIGTVGFIIKKDYILKTDYDPYFSHLDCMQDLIRLGYNKFAMVKLDVIHLHSSSFFGFIGKLKRNFNIIIRDYNKRRYKWEASLFLKIYAVLVMLTFIVPFYHSFRGYYRVRDFAWFLHPFVCFSVMMMYLGIFLQWKLGLYSVQ